MREKVKRLNRLVRPAVRRGWRILRGPGTLGLGAGFGRVALEAGLLSLLFFGLLRTDPVIVDYRLLALQHLPGALVAMAWGAFRLRWLVKVRQGFWPVRLFARTWLAGLGLAAVIVLMAFLVNLLQYPLEELAAPQLSDLFSNPSNGVYRIIFSLLEPLLSFPGGFSPGTAWPVVIGTRLLVFTIELAVVFCVARLGVGILAVPVRWVRRQSEQRLIWRTTLSHFWVVLISLVAVVGALIAVITIASAFTDRDTTETPSDLTRNIAAYSAQRVATVYGAENNLSPTDSEAFLRQITFNFLDPGSTQFTLNPSERLQRMINGVKGNNSELSMAVVQSNFIALVDNQGRVIASSRPLLLPAGQSFLDSNLIQPHRSDWQTLLTLSRQAQTDPAHLVRQQTTQPVLIAGAYPVLNGQGQVLATVLVEERPELAVYYAAQNLLALFVTILVTLVLLTPVSVVTVFVALLFGYLFSRRLVRNLERLSRAAEGLATGDLEQRVEIEGQDEVARLADRFNSMASHLQQSQARLEQEKGKVEQALQYKRELVANVSHELRTPVTTIRAHIDWLMLSAEQSRPQPSADGGSPASSELHEYLNIINLETERLSALIEDLLDLARIDSQGQGIHLETVDTLALIEEIRLALGRPAQRERKITLTTQLPAELPLARADRQRLAQVLLNLTRNAINYTPAGGIVSLGAEYQDGQIALWVADTGVGIAPADLPHLFERFYRSDASRSRNTGGAGLGLAIVKALVEAMGGVISVESVLGEGSRFTVTLPVVANPAAPDATGSSFPTKTPAC